MNYSFFISLANQRRRDPPCERNRIVYACLISKIAIFQRNVSVRIIFLKYAYGKHEGGSLSEK